MSLALRVMSVAVASMSCAFALQHRSSSRVHSISVRTTKAERSPKGQPQGSGVATMNVPVGLTQRSPKSGDLKSSRGCNIEIAIDGPSAKPIRGTLEPLMKKTRRPTINLGRFLGVARTEKLGDGRRNVSYELLGQHYDITISSIVDSKACEDLLKKTVHTVADSISVN